MPTPLPSSQVGGYVPEESLRLHVEEPEPPKVRPVTPSRDAGHVVYPTSVESDTPTPSLGHTSKRGLFFSSGAFGACCFAQRRTGDPPRRVP